VRPFKPTPEQIAAAYAKTIPDVIGPGLKVLFCGINPGLYSGAVGHHFARPGNRFWPTLHRAGFTPRQLSPFEGRELLPWGWGVTNIVDRATVAADELTSDELLAGAKTLRRKVSRWKPTALAVLGVSAYRAAFARPKAKLGEQDERIGATRVWVLPNPSGLNAHYQIAELARMFAEMREAIEK
jgi:double-stranded uracil-DNA glycosylase